LPSLRGPTDAARVRALLASMPGLVELSLGRRYTCFNVHHAALAHPALAPLPPPRPWAPGWGEAHFSILFDHFCQRFDLLWSQCAEILERDFDELAEPVQAAWGKLWPALAAAAAEPSLGIRCSVQVFARAMQALLEEHPGGAIRALLNQLEGTQTPVEIRGDGPARSGRPAD
jgi:hypothetical protein